MSSSCFPALLPIVATLLLPPASTMAAVTVIDFEGFAEFSQLTNEVPGLIFLNAEVLRATGALNWQYFPPFSGDAVIGSMPWATLAVDFATPVSEPGGYFTYLQGPLTLSFYGAGSVLLGTVTSSYSDNWEGSGNPPNEYLQFSSPAGITRMEAAVATGKFPGVFTMDDLTFSSVPEPASAMVNMILGATGIGLTLRRRRC